MVGCWPDREDESGWSIKKKKVEKEREKKTKRMADERTWGMMKRCVVGWKKTTKGARSNGMCQYLQFGIGLILHYSGSTPVQIAHHIALLKYS